MSDNGQLDVRGGAGGTSARLEDLERAGELLSTAAAGLADHGRAVVSASVDPRLQVTAPLSPVTFARAEAALAGAAFGPGGLFALSARAELLGTGVLTVAEGYKTAETIAAGALRGAATVAGQNLGRALGAVAPAVLAATAVTVVVLSSLVDRGDQGRALPEPLRRTGGLALRLLASNASLTETAIPVLPGVIGGLITTVPGGPVISARIFGRPAGPTTMREVAAGLGVIGRLTGAATGAPPWFRDPNEVQVRVAPAPWHGPPSGTADLLDRIPVAAAHRPQIHVERVDSAAGRHWVVSVPGTGNWSPVAGRTPFDLTGDVRLMAGERTAGMAGVLEAMRAVGVRKGEPVLLVGHSQGGLIAAAVAADPLARREFTVTHVLTSGAPIASVPVPDEVQVLSIEHSDDLVPRLEGSANRDRPNWITVTAPAPTADVPRAERTEPLLAHRRDLYRSTGERVDRSTHPSLAMWRTGLTPFLDAGRGSGAGWDVDVSRVGTS